jgi:hypothetical protein
MDETVYCLEDGFILSRINRVLNFIVEYVSCGGMYVNTSKYKVVYAGLVGMAIGHQNVQSKSNVPHSLYRS